MVIVPRHKLAFVHIPKTGGSSITAALLRVQGLPVPAEKHGWQTKHHKRGRLHSGYEHLEGWTGFTVIRDPLEIVASFYAVWSHTTRPNAFVNATKKFKTYLDYVRAFTSQPLFRPRARTLTSFCTCPRTGKSVELLLRFSHLDEDWASLLRVFDIDHVDLPKRNITAHESRPEDYMALYEGREGEQAAEIVMDHYREDYENFRELFPIRAFP